jgi:hypothetical protein
MGTNAIRLPSFDGRPIVDDFKGEWRSFSYFAVVVTCRISGPYSAGSAFGAILVMRVQRRKIFEGNRFVIDGKRDGVCCTAKQQLIQQEVESSRLQSSLELAKERTG